MSVYLSLNHHLFKQLSDFRNFTFDQIIKTAYNLKVSEVIMMQENNLLNRNRTNDTQGVKSTYALVILISSIETENQLSYCGSTIGTKKMFSF